MVRNCNHQYFLLSSPIDDAERKGLHEKTTRTFWRGRSAARIRNSHGNRISDGSLETNARAVTCLGVVGDLL